MKLEFGNPQHIAANRGDRNIDEYDMLRFEANKIGITVGRHLAEDGATFYKVDDEICDSIISAFAVLNRLALEK